MANDTSAASRRPLHVQDLAHVRCQNPDCAGGDHPIYIEPTCHPKAGTDIAFDKDRLVLLVQCHQCKEPICEIAVATGTTH
jgi:hypothetical protein